MPPSFTYTYLPPKHLETNSEPHAFLPSSPKGCSPSEAVGRQEFLRALRSLVDFFQPVRFRDEAFWFRPPETRNPKPLEAPNHQTHLQPPRSNSNEIRLDKAMHDPILLTRGITYGQGLRNKRWLAYLNLRHCMALHNIIILKVMQEYVCQQYQS